MKKKVSILFLLMFYFGFSQSEYCSFFMMNHEIKHTLEEHKRQKKIKSNEDVNMGLETTNKGKWNDLKTKVKKIQDRLKIVDLALQGIPTLVVAGREYKDIKNNQERILMEIQTLPPNIVDVFNREVKFYDELLDSIKYFIGVVASYGIINQMERTERKILIDYGLDEVRRLKNESDYTLHLIRQAKWAMERQNAKVQFIVNRDKKLVEDTIGELKGLF